MAGFPRLTELIILYPHPHNTRTKATGILLDLGEATSSTMFELVGVCKALTGFDTLQIVRFLPRRPSPTWMDLWWGGQSESYATQRDEALTE